MFFAQDCVSSHRSNSALYGFGRLWVTGAAAWVNSRGVLLVALGCEALGTVHRCGVGLLVETQHTQLCSVHQKAPSAGRL